MAGVGSNFVLDKGFLVLSTYNSSTTTGVTKERVVALQSDGTIDINTTATARSLGVVQESIDRDKVATGDAIASVRLMGIASVAVANPTSIALDSRVTAGTAGGVVVATSNHIPIGVVVGAPTTIGTNDIVKVLLTPGMPAIGD